MARGALAAVLGRKFLLSASSFQLPASSFRRGFWSGWFLLADLSAVSIVSGWVGDYATRIVNDDTGFVVLGLDMGILGCF